MIARKNKRFIVFSLITCLIIIMSIFLFIGNKQDITIDNNSKFSSSSNAFMTYSDGNLSVMNPQKSKTDIYSQNSKENYSDYSVKYKNNLIYSDKDGLYIDNKNINDIIKVSDTEVSEFIVNDDVLLFTKNKKPITTLFLYHLDSGITETVNTDDGYSYQWFDLKDNILYAASSIFSGIVTEKHRVKTYDLKTLKSTQTVDFYAEDMVDFFLCGNSVYYNEHELGYSEFYKVDFTNKSTTKLFEDYFVINAVSNNDYIFYNNRYYTMALYETTEDYEDNGIWRYDVKSGELKKISSECVYDDLLATDNYLYCYRIDYLLPRGMANYLYKGYTLKQIPVK